MAPVGHDSVESTSTRDPAPQPWYQHARHAALRADVQIALSEPGTIRAVLQRCAEALVAHLDAAFARIWLLAADAPVLELQASAGRYTHLDGYHSRIPVGQLKIGLIAEERRPYLTNAVVGDPRIEDQDWAQREGMVAFAGYPLIVEARLVGVVALFARVPLGAETLDAIASVATALAQGIERKRAEERLRATEAEYRSIFEATSDGLLISDFAGTIAAANPAADHLFGYTGDEWHGLPFGALVQPGQQGRLRDYLAAVEAAGQSRVQLNGRCKDGRALPIESQGTIFAYQGRPHLLSVVRDVTERVEAYRLLEERVAERTAELSALLAISHDIAGTLDQQRLLDLVLAGLQPIVHYRGALLLLLEGDEAIVAVCSLPPDTATPLGRRFPLRREGAVWAMLANRTAVLIADLAEETPTTRDFLALLGAHLDADPRTSRSWLVVPLAHEERLIGLLLLAAAHPYHFTPRHAELARTIANQAAVALENARLYAQAQGMAALEERQRLARELHDSVVQALYGVTLSTEAATRLLVAGDTALTATYLREIRETAEEALKEMRLLIFELRPPILEREGLVAALQARLDTVEGRAGGLEAALELHGTAPLPPAIEEVFYRVAQEALNNVLKHARARRVTVTLDLDGPVPRLLIADDGVGFDAHGDGSRRGLGLRGMAERAAQVGGNLSVESTPGRGTLVRLEVPR